MLEKDQYKTFLEDLSISESEHQFIKSLSAKLESIREDLVKLSSLDGFVHEANAILSEIETIQESADEEYYFARYLEVKKVPGTCQYCGGWLVDGKCLACNYCELCGSYKSNVNNNLCPACQRDALKKVWQKISIK